MEKAVQTVKRETLIVKTSDSGFFEEAHFILRSGLAVEKESEMIREANRILANYNLGKKGEKRVKRAPSPLFYFAAGIVCGLLFTAACGAIFSFFGQFTVCSLYI